MIMALAALFLLASCSKEGPVRGRMPIRFEGGSQAQTKAAPGSRLEMDFMVYGTKTTVAEEELSVFDGTRVRYKGGSFTYSPEKFWDPKAAGYSFWGYAPADADVDLSDGRILFRDLIPSRPAYIAMQTNNQVAHENIGETVVMGFSPVVSRFRIGVYETMEDYKITYASYTISATILTQGDVELDVKDGSVVSVTNAIDEGSVSRYFHVAEGIGHSAQTAYTRGYTSVLPTNAALAKDLTLTIHAATFVHSTGRIRELEKEIVAVVPKEMVVWDVNKQYTYIFKFSDLDIAFDSFTTVELDVQDWTDRSDWNGAELGAEQ